jgi:hypothetical protein
MSLKRASTDDVATMVAKKVRFDRVEPLLPADDKTI